MINFTYFMTCLKAAVHYIPQNFILTFWTLLVSIIIGTLIAMCRSYNVPVAKQIFTALMALGKALPTNLVLLVCMMLYTNNFARVTKALHINVSIKNVSLNYVAVFALVICVVPSISEVIRGGLLSVNKGQYEAGYSIGLTKAQTFFNIILPQVIRVIIPPLTNSILSLMKTTALVSVIGVFDILNGAKTAASEAYCYLEAYIAAALVFWVIGFVLEQISRRVEKQFNRSVKILA